MPLKEFLVAVFSKWFEIVGIILTILPFVQKVPYVKRFLHDKPVLERYAAPLLLIIGLACIFWGFYSAWHDQRDAKLIAERRLEDLSKPKLELTLSQSINQYFRDTDDTVAWLAVQILNRGADTAVTGYSLHYESPTLNQDVNYAHFTKPMVLPVGDFRVEMQEQNLIYNKTLSPIPRGGMAIGRLPVLIHGNHLDEITTGKAKITVKISDYLGQWSTAVFQSTALRTGPMGLPGELPMDKEVKPPAHGER